MKTINHSELNDDLKNGYATPEHLIPAGKICESPETWAIDGDMDHSDRSYLYESEHEYNSDVKTLQL